MRKAKQQTENLKHMVKENKDKAIDKAVNVKTKVVHATDNVKVKAVNAKDNALETVVHAKDNVKEKATLVKEKAAVIKEKARDVKQKAVSKVTRGSGDEEHMSTFMRARYTILMT